MDRTGRVMLYEELTAKIIGVCFEVIRELGSGFLENIYQKALLLALRQAGVKAAGEVHLDVEFRGVVVGQYIADIVVDGKVIVEVKAVQALHAEHQAQLINYLKATGLEVGLLVNFGRPKMEFKRLYA